MNTLDIILLGIAAAFALWGIWRGLVATVIGLGGYVVAFIGARMWGPAVGEMFKGTSWINSLERIINENLANIGVNGVDPAAVNDFLTNSEMGEQIANNPIFESLFGSVSSIGSGVTGATEVLVSVVCVALGYLLVFFGVKLGVSLVGLVIRGLIRTSKVLTFTDRVLGLGVGALIGVALCVVTVTFVLPVAMSYSSEIQEMAQGSVLSGLLLQLAGLFI